MRIFVQRPHTKQRRAKHEYTGRQRLLAPYHPHTLTVPLGSNTKGAMTDTSHEQMQERNGTIRTGVTAFYKGQGPLELGTDAEPE